VRLASFAALRFLQKLNHRGGSNNPGGFVTFQGEEALVAGHEKRGLAKYDFGRKERLAWERLGTRKLR